jgi:hypothetical protein
VSLEDILFLTTQVAETSSLEEVLRDRRRLEEALKVTQAALNAIKVEVEAACPPADRAEARRIGMYFGQFLFLRLPSRGVGVP